MTCAYEREVAASSARPAAAAGWRGCWRAPDRTGPSSAKRGAGEAGGADHLHQMPAIRSAGRFPSDLYRGRVDVARQHPAMQRLGGGDPQYAGAGAEVEHAARLIGLQHVVEQQQAAAGGAVMAGAEGERCLDLDAELVGRYPVPVVLSVDDEAARPGPGSGLQGWPSPSPSPRAVSKIIVDLRHLAAESVRPAPAAASGRAVRRNGRVTSQRPSGRSNAAKAA